jgi:hypothetical protein
MMFWRGPCRSVICQHLASLISGAHSQRPMARLNSGSGQKASRWGVARADRAPAGPGVTAVWYCTN